MSTQVPHFRETALHIFKGIIICDLLLVEGFPILFVLSPLIEEEDDFPITIRVPEQGMAKQIVHAVIGLLIYLTLVPLGFLFGILNKPTILYEGITVGKLQTYKLSVFSKTSQMTLDCKRSLPTSKEAETKNQNI